jgi:hypothetical protein
MGVAIVKTLHSRTGIFMTASHASVAHPATHENGGAAFVVGIGVGIGAAVAIAISVCGKA